MSAVSRPDNRRAGRVFFPAWMAAAVFLTAGLAAHSPAAAADRQEAFATLDAYLRSIYARDYHEAYQFIAERDQRLKDRRSYIRDRGAFSGFTLAAARKLASYIEWRPLESRFEENRARVKVAVRVPDPDQTASVLYDWNSERLESLSAADREAALERLDGLQREGKLTMAEGSDAFELVKEGNAWKIALNWAAGVRVSFHSSIPAGIPVRAEIEQTEIASAPGEIFQVTLKIKNAGKEQFLARIGHVVDPHELRDYLDLVDCGFLLPVTLAPEKEETFTSTYLVRANLPEGVRRLGVTYALTVAP